MLLNGTKRIEEQMVGFIKHLVFDKCVDFEPVDIFKNRRDMTGFGSFDNCRSKRVGLDVY